MNKQEFLKRYLSHNVKTEDVPQKKKRKIKKIRNIKIVDDDVDFRKVDTDTIDLEIGEEAPIIIGEVAAPETSANANKWRAIVKEEPEDGDEEMVPSSPGAGVGRRTGPDSGDLSPSREGQPSRKRRRHDSSGSEDLSPPDRPDDGSQSPRTRKGQDSDTSPPRQSGQQARSRTERRKAPSPVVIKKEPLDTNEPNTSTQDQRRRPAPVGSRGSDSDPRPRQASGDDSDLSPPRIRPRDSPEPAARVGGLMKLGDHRKESHQLRKQQEEMMKKMDPAAMGKDAAPIFRDKKTLKKRDMEEEQRVKEEKERKEALRKQQYDQWGKGLKQSEKQQTTLEDHVNEMSKPLARYRDDEDLENHLKSKLLSDDPMLSYMMKKQENINKGKKSRPQYKGPPPPQNRFSIAPGYRWDGVDRSNGYEKKLLATRATKISLEDEAYRWSIQDM